MSEWFDNQKQTSSNFQKLLKERIEKANPRRKLSAEETKRLSKLEGIADKLKRGENGVRPVNPLLLFRAVSQAA